MKPIATNSQENRWGDQVIVITDLTYEKRMSCLEGIGRIILVLINLVVGILWLTVCVLGGIVAWGGTVTENITRGILSQVMKALKSKINSENIDIRAIIDIILRPGKPIGIALFVIGLLLLVVCLFGLCGACYSKKGFLKIFGVILVLLIIAQILILLLYFSRPELFINHLKKELTKTTLEYKGFEAKNSESVLWNLIQTSLQCCGSDSASDFENPPSGWNHRKNQSSAITIKYPITCCKMDKNLNILNNTCPTIFDEFNSNINKSCFQALRDEIRKHINIVLYVVIGVTVGQTILAAIAFGIGCAKDEHIKY